MDQSPSAWLWRPSTTGINSAMRGWIRHWDIDGLSEKDAILVRENLRVACLNNADWLYHPFTSQLLGDRGPEALFCELQLLGWVALNTSLPDIPIAINTNERMVTATGDPIDQTTPRSVYSLAQSMRNDGIRRLLLLSGSGDEHSFAINANVSAALLNDVDRIARVLPSVASWLSIVKGVILIQSGGSTFRTKSWRERPGLIQMTATDDPMETLEAFVHEAAHLYLYRIEWKGSLICGTDTNAYRSPLRAEPRPLRGVLLAMHACAYIAAAFDEAARAGYDNRSRCVAQRDEMINLYQVAKQTLSSNYHNLTSLGKRVVVRTIAVGDAVSSNGA